MTKPDSQKERFTKGPWRYNLATNGEIVAPQQRGPDVTVVEADAANPNDAHLIAAAPELYEALKELASIVEIHSECTDNNFAWAEMIEARAIIAKAQGAQS